MRFFLSLLFLVFLSMMLSGAGLFNGFSLLIHSDSRNKIHVADMKKDGSVFREIVFPAFHPMLQIAHRIEADYYTESFSFSLKLNEFQILKGHLPKMYPSSRFLLAAPGSSR